MCRSYLATESSHDTSCWVDSLNNSRITVKKSVGQSKQSSRSQQTYYVSWGMHVQLGVGWRLDQSEFQLIVEVSLPVLLSPANAKRKETYTSRELISRIKPPKIPCFCAAPVIKGPYSPKSHRVSLFVFLDAIL